MVEKHKWMLIAYVDIISHASANNGKAKKTSKQIDATDEDPKKTIPLEENHYNTGQIMLEIFCFLQVHQ